MRALTRLVLVSGLLAIAAVPLRAQGPGGLREVNVRRGDHSGFWGTIAFGYGSEGFRFDSMTSYQSDFSAPTFTIKLGGTPSRYFRLGAEISTWDSDESNSTQTLSSFLFITQWYPTGRMLYLKGGIGLTRNYQSGSDPINGTYVYKDGGYGGVLGLGVDIPVSRHLALTPEVNVYEQRYNNAGVGNDYRERLLVVGLGLTFQ